MVSCTDDGTLVPSKDGTLKHSSPSGTLVELESDLGTMVINSDVDDQTMKSKLVIKSQYCLDWFYIFRT